MADEQKPIPKPISTVPLTPPIVDSGVVNSVPTVSGTERLNTVIPELDLNPELKGIVKIVEQPENQIGSPVPVPEKTVEINRVPSGSVPVVGQTPKAPTEVIPVSDNPKIIDFKLVKDIVAHRKKPLISPIGVEVIKVDANEPLAELEVKVEEKKELEEAA